MYPHSCLNPIKSSFKSHENTLNHLFLAKSPLHATKSRFKSHWIPFNHHEITTKHVQYRPATFQDAAATVF